MNQSKSTYHENLLHWIWETLQFDHRRSCTSSGQQIEIRHTGTRNESDGPDFKGAEITIGGLRWYGDVEIHWKLSDWNVHNHQQDHNFDQVILHVVFQETDHTIRRKDGSLIPTLCLSPLLSKPLQSFMKQYITQPQLPCSAQFSFISQEAFRLQLEKAHKEYFEQKINDLLAYYDPNLTPSEAWKKMFCIALFDGLGIAHNRSPMRALAEALYKPAKEITSARTLRAKGIALSGIRKKDRKSSEISWNHKGCRPGNHPLPRIQQATDCLWYIHGLPFNRWLRENPQKLWDDMIASINVTPALGNERGSILYGTVYLPALYSLGNLFYSEQLKSKSWSLWNQHRASIPKSLLKLFHNTNLPRSLYNKKLGSIHQLRSYCRPKECQRCKVFKHAISS